MQRFMALPTWARLLIIIVIAGLIYALAMWVNSRDEERREQQQDSSTDIINTPAPTQPAPTPTEIEEPEPSGLGLESHPEWIGQMNLEVEDADAARAALDRSLLEYYRVLPTENAEARTARLSQFIAPGSDLFNSTPLGDAETLVDESMTLEGAATINTEDDMGGNGDEYRALVSLNTEMLLTFPAETGEAPQLFQGNEEIEVRMLRVNGTWMLAEVIAQ